MHNKAVNRTFFVSLRLGYSGYATIPQNSTTQKMPITAALALFRSFMTNDEKPISVKISAALLVVSGIFLYSNFAIGDTIFANIIVLFISGISGLGSLGGAFGSIIDNRRSLISYMLFILSLGILITIFILFYTNNVAAGYGP